MVYIGAQKRKYGRMQLSHMVATTHEELMAFLVKCDLRQKWIQYRGTYKEHYDICKTEIKKAIKLGAVIVPEKVIIAVIHFKKTGNFDPLLILLLQLSIKITKHK